MAWWSWILFGTLLFATELLLVDLELYLIFIGVAAIVVGLVDLGDMPWQPWGEWLTFAVASAISVAILRRQRLQRGRR